MKDTNMDRDNIEVNRNYVVYPDELAFQVINPPIVRRSQRDHGKSMTYNLGLNRNMITGIVSMVKTHYRQETVKKRKS